MPYPLTPADDIMGPTVTALGNYLSTQISGLGRVYTKVPDGPPEDNSLMLPITRTRFEGDTNGKVYVCFTVAVHYIVRGGKFPDAVQRLYTMFSSIARVMSSWPNQTVGGVDISITPKEASFSRWVDAGTPFVALITTVEVRTEFNILLS